MFKYVTVSDVDVILGATWADEDKKAKAVLQANVWIGEQGLCDFKPDAIPEYVVTAGAYIASVAAAGNLYVQKEGSGIVTGESVKAGSVSVSNTTYAGAEFMNTDELLDPDLQLAIGMLSPYICRSAVNFSVKRG